MLSKWHFMVDQKLRVFYTSIHPLLPILVRVTGSLFQLPQGKRQGAPRTDRLTEPPVAVIPSVATVVMKTSERKSKYRYICIWWNEIHSVPDASMLLAVLKCCDWWHNVVTHQLHAVVLKLPGKLWYFTIWFWHNIKKTQNFHLSWLVYFPQMWIETLTTVLTLKITSCELEIKYNKADTVYILTFIFDPSYSKHAGHMLLWGEQRRGLAFQKLYVQ